MEILALSEGEEAGPESCVGGILKVGEGEIVGSKMKAFSDLLL